MDWIYLIIAGISEIGWPLGLKLSQTTTHKIPWIFFAIATMGLSSYFLWIAQKSIPIGTAYAVWTGIGAVGTFLVGILLFKDPSNLFRFFSVLLIVMGIIGLKISHP